MATEVSMKALLEAGIHFGHQTKRWHPRMKKYIYTQRNGIHIIDLQQTLVFLEKAMAYVKELIASGEDILFVGTKKQAQEAVEEEAKRGHMPYVNQRWLGGTLTNFATLQSRIDHLVRLEDRKTRGEFDHLPKKEAMKLERRIARLNRLFGGVKEMTRMPGALFIIDTVKERNALIEARKGGVPVVAIVDTDSNPDLVDYPIPGNDDAVRSIKLLTASMANAVLEGLAIRQAAPEVPEVISTTIPTSEEGMVPKEKKEVEAGKSGSR